MFKQKNFKNEERASNSISEGKMAGTKEEKNEQKNKFIKKIRNIIQAQFLPKIRKTFIYPKHSCHLRGNMPTALC